MAEELIPRGDCPRSANGIADCGAAGYFLTGAMDVASYAAVFVSVWRERIVGSCTRVAVSFQQSEDEFHWVNCGGTDVCEDAQVKQVVEVERRSFRAPADFAAPDPSASWTELLPRRADGLDLSENGRTMLALRASGVGRRDSPGASD